MTSKKRRASAADSIKPAEGQVSGQQEQTAKPRTTKHSQRKRRDKRQNTGAGIAFEQNVAKQYEAIGYKVQHNVSLSGQQIDLLVSKIVRGVGLIRTAVECKFNARRNVGNQQVYDFIAVIKSLQERNSLSAGVMITNTGYTAAAKQAARGSPLVRLLTDKDLDADIFDVYEVYSAFVRNYEQSAIANSYISLRGVNSSNLAFLPQGDISDVERELLHWIASDTPGFVSILGDYGAGKTTLLERLKYRCAQQCIVGAAQRRPVLILLRDYHQCGSLDALLRFTLHKEFSQDIPMPVFWRAVDQGELLLMLDGFDEMTPQVDRAKRTENILILSRLLTSRSKAILTCRPAYFISVAEYNNAIDAINLAGRRLELALPRKDMKKHRGALRNRRPSRTAVAVDEAQTTFNDERHREAHSLRDHLFISMIGDTQARHLDTGSTGGTITISGLSEEQIRFFLQRHDSQFRATCGHGWEAVEAFLVKVYDLRDLMRRPILLTMITKTVLSGKIDIMQERVTIGAAELYEIYTSMQFEWDWHKGTSRQLLTKEQRLQFAQAIALAMFDKGKLEVSYDEILSTAMSNRVVLYDLRQRLTKITAEQIAADIQTCTFLSRSEDDVFRFAHKSFMEFFVARHIRVSVQQSRLDSHMLRRMPREVHYFLGSFTNVDPTLWDWFAAQLNKSRTKDTELRTNLASAMLFTSGPLPLFSIRRCAVNGVDIIRSTMVHSALVDLTLTSVTVQAWVTQTVTFERVHFIDARIDGWSSEKDQGNLQLTRVEIRRLELVGAALSVSGRDSSIERLTMERGSLDIAGRIVISGSTLKLGTLNAHGWRGEPIELLDGNIDSQTVNVAHASLRRCKLRHGTLSVGEASRIEEAEFKDVALSFSGSANGLVEAVGCRVLENELNLSWARLQACDLRDVSCRGKNVHLMDTSKKGGALHLTGEARLERCSFDGGTTDLVGNATDSRQALHCIFNAMRLRGRTVILEACQFGSSDLELEGACRLSDCRMEGGCMRSEGRDTSSIEISKSEFRNARIVMAAATLSDVVFRGGNLTMNSVPVQLTNVLLVDVDTDIHHCHANENSSWKLEVRGGSIVGLGVTISQLSDRAYSDLKARGILFITDKRENVFGPTGEALGFALDRTVVAVKGRTDLFVVPLCVCLEPEGLESINAQLVKLELAHPYVERLRWCVSHV